MGGAQLGHSLGVFFVVGGLAVPIDGVFHVADAQTLGGAQQEAGGLAAAVGQVKHLEGLLQIGEGVAVADDGVEAEGIHLVVQRLGVHDIAGRAVDLQAVDIDHDAQVIELVVVGEHERLPAFALFDLTVAQQGVDVDVAAQLFGTQRHAAGGGNTLAQGTGAHVNTGDGVHVGVVLLKISNISLKIQMVK